MFIGHGQLSPNIVPVLKNGIATAQDVIFGVGVCMCASQ
jgi:hypothetical protein